MKKTINMITIVRIEGEKYKVYESPAGEVYKRAFDVLNRFFKISFSNNKTTHCEIRAFT